MSPCLDDDDMLGIEPLELHFAFEPNKEISCKVELTNGTGNCIAFNIETPSMYPTQPSKGIVQPRSKCTVGITLQAQQMVPGEHHPDEFTVTSMKVEDGLKDEDVSLHMFILDSKATGKVVDEVNFTVVYIKKTQVEQSLEPPTELDNAPTSKGINSRRSKDTKRLNFRPAQIPSVANVSYQYKTSDRAIDLMTGAMGSLLPKLRQLLKQEQRNLQSVMKDFESLMEQLTDMHTTLSNLSQEQVDQLHPQDKRWANKVKELSYDIEDIVDNFLARIIGRSEPITNKEGIRGLLVQKMFSLIKWIRGTPNNIAQVIQDIKIRVKELADGRAEFKLDNFSTDHTATSTYCDRLSALYSKTLFGIDGPRDELVEKLTGRAGGVSQQQLKIISIFGDGGLGKTTLAKAVYDKVQAEFNRTAFISVGRNPDMKEVLEDILLELDRSKYGDIHNKRWKEKNLIDEIHNVLRNKRYLIVVDDIWDIASWGEIKYALIDDDCRSRVITTSRKFHVAERNGPPDEQPTKYILQKCGGVPLAIITIASLLACKKQKDWPKVYSSIGFGHEDDTEVNNTRKILLLSYYDLPWHLKTCLLYLSIFPQYRDIQKDTLVWRWIAEGFVYEEPGNALFKVGERYFHELIDRSLIQPVEEQKTCNIYGCRVHDMVLDMICSTAQKENFVTILVGDDQHLSSQSSARILAIQKRSVLEQDGLASTCNPKVRSFSGIGCSIGNPKVRSFSGIGCSIGIAMPSLQSFQVLRVLSLEGCTLSGDAYDLKNLAGLHLLRYLGLNGTHLHDLPTEMGDLRSLHTLDLRGTQIEALPHSVTLLRQLKCLQFDAKRPLKFLPDGMGNLTSLEDLHLYLPIDSLSFNEELGKLTELRVLHIYTHVFLGKNWNEAFVESLSKLQKIEELVLFGGGVVNEPNWDGFLPSGQLRDLRLDIYSPGLPAWIYASLLPNLTHLDIYVRYMKATDVDILGGLPELLSLVLSTSEKPFFHAAASHGAFPKLRCCYMRQLLLTYQLGAMPCLESVKLDLPVQVLQDANFDLKEFDSLSYLPLLREVLVYVWCHEAMREEVEEAEAAVRHAVDNHGNCPILVLDRMGYCKDEWVRSRLLQMLMPKSKHLDLTEQSNDHECQQGAGKQEGSGSQQIQATEQESENQR
ncbi:hypothetical protein BS78_06G018500 [Paspalum vaginatum]|nr:hypothetical protein BS78_06G018500 [Paspalum vaginatum]